MVSRGRRLVVGFGFEPGSCGWAATADLVNYEIKRRLGEWESNFVGAAGHLVQAIVADSHDDAVALREYLNNQPAATVRSLAAERGLSRPKVEVLRAILEEALRSNGAGEHRRTLADAVWTTIDASEDRARDMQQGLIERAARAQPKPRPQWADFNDFPFAAVVFDLDQTLIDSSALGSPEARRAWASHGGDDGRVRPLGVRGSVDAHDLPALLAERNVPVAIATRSPNRYAERVLARFGIHADTVQSGTGNKAASIRACARSLGVSVSDVVVIGDDESDIRAAREVSARSLGALWAPAHWPDRLQPDIACREPETLLRFADWSRLGFLAEQPLAVDPHVHGGSWITYGGSRTRALGRYFKAGNERHDDELTRTILEWKRRDDPHPLVERALVSMGERVRERASIDFVTSVPAADGQIDRFSNYRDLAAEAFGAKPAEILQVLKPLPGYKSMSHERRSRESGGRFAAEGIVGGRHVLVLDDVTTSGSTFAACESALRAAGASEVSCLAFAATQD